MWSTNLFSGIEKTVSGLEGTTLIAQFGGARVHQGESGAWRATTMPNQALLSPTKVATQWHYGGTVDFGVFYFPDQPSGIVARRAKLATSANTPLQFGDPLVIALALQIVRDVALIHDISITLACKPCSTIFRITRALTCRSQSLRVRRR